MEIYAGRLQEAVFEVVEVEHDVRLIHLGLGIADREIEALASENLQAWQLGNGAPQQFLFPLAVLPAGLTAVFQGIEEGARAQVFLQIAALIGGDGQHLRHREALLTEMMGEGDEGVVLLHGGADDTDDGVAGC